MLINKRWLVAIYEGKNSIFQFTEEKLWLDLQSMIIKKTTNEDDETWDITGGKLRCYDY